MVSLTIITWYGNNVCVCVQVRALFYLHNSNVYDMEINVLIV